MSNSPVDQRYNILIESRLTKLETIIENHEKTFDRLDRDYRWLIGILIISILLPYVNAILKTVGILP